MQNQADHAVQNHYLTETYKHQARVSVSDMVLYQGLRAEKARIKPKIKNLDIPGGADYVYGTDISELVHTALRRGFHRVLESVTQFAQIPYLDGKADIKSNVEGRVNRQE